MASMIHFRVSMRWLPVSETVRFSSCDSGPYFSNLVHFVFIPICKKPIYQVDNHYEAIFPYSDRMPKNNLIITLL